MIRKRSRRDSETAGNGARVTRCYFIVQATGWASRAGGAAGPSQTTSHELGDPRNQRRGELVDRTMPRGRGSTRAQRAGRAPRAGARSRLCPRREGRVGFVTGRGWGGAARKTAVGGQAASPPTSAATASLIAGARSVLGR